jgi:hypothetical protein
MYDTATQAVAHSQVTTSVAKTFVIPHPIESTKYLVHACLEGPEAGIYYRGEGIISKGESEIHLPCYADAIGRDWTVQVTYTRDDGSPCAEPIRTSRVRSGKFKVWGSDGPFAWTVQGMRHPLIVEPDCDKVQVAGNGPYQYLM